MKMMLPDGCMMERPAFMDKPQHLWTDDESRQMAEIQRMHSEMLEKLRAADSASKDNTSEKL